MSQKDIEAVIEINPFDGKPPWAIASSPNFSFLRLFFGITDKEIGDIMLTACTYNSIEICTSANETLTAFISEDFVLPGGLQFLENNQVKIYPGCCSGLEDWRDWLEVPSGETVWAGHDPSPGVEFINEGIRVWQDEKGDDVDFIDFKFDEMRELLEKVENDLKEFVVRLEKWCDLIAPSLKQKIVQHFVANMHI